MLYDEVIDILDDLKKWLEMTNRTSNGVTINDDVFDAIGVAIDCVEQANKQPMKDLTNNLMNLLEK